MKTKQFKFIISQEEWLQFTSEKSLQKIEKFISDFCKTVNILDMKINVEEDDYFNDCGKPGLMLIYTIVYEEK